MRILFITTNFKHGGAATGARNLASCLEYYGHEVIKVDKYYNTGFRYFFFGLFRLVERIIERCFLYKDDSHFVKIGPASLDVISLVERFRPDIVQFGFIAGNIISYKDIRKISKPVYMRVSDFWPFHGVKHYPSFEKKQKSLLSGFLFRMFMKNFYFENVSVICPSEWTKDKLLESDFIFNGVSFIPNAVDVSVDVKVSNSFAFDFLVISGNLDDPRKGILNFLKFFKLAVECGLKMKLSLIGRYSQRLKKIVNSMGLAEHVSFLGLLDSLVVKEHIAKAKFLICPSTYDNSPNVVTEAFSLGTPVIAQSYTGMNSYVRHGFNGFLLDFNDCSKSNVNHFNNLFINDLVELRYNAHQSALIDFSYNSIAKKYTHVYS